MPKFKIYGADSNTAKDISVEVTADTPMDAESIALDRGIFVSRVVEVMPPDSSHSCQSLANITCKVCDQGVMRRRTVHRLSGPAVTVGYIFLIPSILGMIIGGVIMIITIVGTISTSGLFEDVARDQMAHAGISETIISEVINDHEISNTQRDELTDDQKTVLDNSIQSVILGPMATQTSGVVGIGFSIFIIIASIVGGLIGWLLTMKKTILKCKACGAVINAS